MPQSSAHRFDVPMKKADLVYGLNSAEDLMAEPQGRGQAEGSSGLGSPQLRQVLALQLHHHVVEALVTAASNEAAHVVPTWGERGSLEGARGRRQNFCKVVGLVMVH